MTEWMVVISIRNGLGHVASHVANPVCATRADAFRIAQQAVVALLRGETERTVTVTFWYCEPNHPVTP